MTGIPGVPDHIVPDQTVPGQITAGQSVPNRAVATQAPFDGSDTMILFDWNGTMVTDADRARLALNSALADYGLAAVSPTDFRQVFRLPMEGMFRDLGVPGRLLREAEERWNVSMATQVTSLRQGVIETVQSLSDSGVWLGIVSAASANAVEFDLESLKVPRLFDSVETGVADKIAVLRTHRDLRPTAIYVGDTVYDMQSAIAADYVPIGVSDGYAPESLLTDAGASVIVADLMELIGLLSRPSVMQRQG